MHQGGSSGEEYATPRDQLFWFFIASALALRLLVTFYYPLIHHPDEQFQYLEQAHRLVEGFGLVPWEYRDGIRSWLLPGFLAGVRIVAGWLGDDPMIFPRLAGTLMSLSSLAVVWTGFQWMRRYYGDYAAVLTGSLLAFSPLSLLYSPRILTEVVATHLLFLALYLQNALATWSSSRRYFLSGLVLGLAFVIRIQIVGAVLLLALVLGERKVRERGVPMLGGGTIIVLASGILDWWTWGYPLQPIVKNLQMNIFEGVAASYGETSYIQWTLDLGWGAAWFLPLVALVLGLLVLGRRHNWGFLAIAIGTFVPLSFVAHKEVRYFYPAMPAVLAVAGAALSRFIGPTPGEQPRALLVWSTIVIVAGLFVYLSFFGPLEKHFHRSRSYIEAAVLLHQQEDLCGVAVIDVDWVIGGYTFLNRSVPMYFLTAAQDQSMTERPYNYALTRPADAAQYPDHEVVRCWGEDEVFWSKDLLCVLATRSACEPVHLEYEINRKMVNHGW